jgi:hypothetical protein
MTTDGYEVEVSRELVPNDEEPTVRVTLDSEADEPLRYRLSEAATNGSVTGVLAPGERAVVECPVSAEVSADGSWTDVPVSVTLRPVESAPCTDGGNDGTGPFTVDRPDADEGVGTRAAAHPAVGIVATAATTEAVTRIVTRAVERGYPVYVGHARDVDPEVLEFAERLGGELVALDRSTADEDALQRALVVAARADGHSGIVLSSGREPVDLGASTVALATSGEFAVRAVSESLSTDDGTRSRLDAAADPDLTPGLVVGIPAYNEAGTISDVVERARRVADLVVVVDDGSDDDTADLAAAAGAHVVEHERNEGYGAALRSVFEEAARLDAGTLAIVDGDGQHDMDDIRPLVETRRETDADLVIGSRFVEGSDTRMPVYRRFGVGVVNVLTNLALGRVGDEYIRDTQSGFRVYGPRAIESLAEDTTIGNGMNASTDIIFHVTRHDYRVVEAPTTVRYDLADTSSMNPVSHGFHLVWNIVSRTARERPLRTLGLPGLVSSVAGLLTGYWTFFDSLGTVGTSVLPVVVSALLLALGITSTAMAVSIHSRESSGTTTGPESRA